MKRLLVGAPVLLALGAAGFALAGTTTQTVQLTATGLVPAAATAGTGDTVAWTNATTVPVGLALIGQGVTTLLPVGASYSRVFPAATRIGVRETIGTGKTAKSYRGSLSVHVPVITGNVSLSASKPVIKAGTALTLHGRAPVADVPVLLEQQLRGQRNWVAIPNVGAAVLARPSFTAYFRPHGSAKYRASILSDPAKKKRIYSSTVRVDLVPRLALRVTALRIHTAKPVVLTLQVLTPHSVRSVLFQRFDPSRGGWVGMGNKLVPPKNVVHLTWTVSKGATHIRVVVTRHGIVGTYAPTTSNQLIVTGIGNPPPAPTKHKHKHH